MPSIPGQPGEDGSKCWTILGFTVKIDDEGRSDDDQ